MGDGERILITGVLLALGLVASLAAGRLRLPGLVLVLGLGMVLGSDGLDLLPFDDYGLARSAGIVAVALILFEGGLSSGFAEIRPVLKTSVILATLGTLGTAALAAGAARHRAADGGAGGVDPGPRAAAGPAAGLDRGRHGRRRCVRGAARLHA